MIKNKKIIFGVILSNFLLLSTPIIANNTNKNNDFLSQNSKMDRFEEGKNLLFDTIIEISNIDEVESLLINNKWDNNFSLIQFSDNYDYNQFVFKLFRNDPFLFFSLIFTKPEISERYLEYIYEKGCVFLEIYGEEEINRFINSVSIKDKDILNQISYILSNNDIIKNNICNLTFINNENITELYILDYPIICSIVFIIYGIGLFIYLMGSVIPGDGILDYMGVILAFFIYDIGDIFDCWDWVP